jgi:hypothetical protein
MRFTPFVRELTHEQPEGLRVAGDPQGFGVHGIEAHVADEPGGNLLAARIVPAVHETWTIGLAPSLVDAEKHFARDGVERTNDVRLRYLLCQRLRARGSMADHKAAIVGIHRQRAGADHLAREVARLSQHVVHAQPVHGEEQSVSILRSLT